MINFFKKKLKKTQHSNYIFCVFEILVYVARIVTQECGSVISDDDRRCGLIFTFVSSVFILYYIYACVRNITGFCEIEKGCSYM